MWRTQHLKSSLPAKTHGLCGVVPTGPLRPPGLVSATRVLPRNESSTTHGYFNQFCTGTLELFHQPVQLQVPGKVPGIEILLTDDGNPRSLARWSDLQGPLAWQWDSPPFLPGFISHLKRLHVQFSKFWSSAAHCHHFGSGCERHGYRRDPTATLCMFPSPFLSHLLVNP